MRRISPLCPLPGLQEKLQWSLDPYLTGWNSWMAGRDVRRHVMQFAIVWLVILANNHRWMTAMMISISLIFQPHLLPHPPLLSLLLHVLHPFSLPDDQLVPAHHQIALVGEMTWSWAWGGGGGGGGTAVNTVELSY